MATAVLGGSMLLGTGGEPSGEKVRGSVSIRVSRWIKALIWTFTMGSSLLLSKHEPTLIESLRNRLTAGPFEKNARCFRGSVCAVGAAVSGNDPLL